MWIWIISAAAAIAIVLLAIQIIGTLLIGRKSLYSKPAGSVSAGVFYALGQGMLPWEKESASEHLPTYLGGVVYHFGILASLIVLIESLAEFHNSQLVEILLRVALASGVIAGIGLLLKRIVVAHMRAISDSDDFVSNGLVTISMALALMTTFDAGFRTAWYAFTTSLLLYIPFGKIRHCVFFFYSRFLFGEFFGRRGILPHKVTQS